MRIEKHILHVAEKAFVKGAYTPVISLKSIIGVRFVMSTEVVAKQKW